MLEINFVRENEAKVKDSLGKRGYDPGIVDRVLRVDETRRQLIGEIERLRGQRNKLDQKEIEEGKKIKEALRRLEPDLRAVEEELTLLLYEIPNLPAADVPAGKDDSENKEIKKWGKIPQFSFKVKDHFKLGESLGIIDVKRAAKVSGSRFGYLKGPGALLELALVNFGFKFLVGKGFIPIIPPSINKKEVEQKLGYADRGGWDQMYLFEKDGLNFVSSAEHTIIPQHLDETLEEKDLPLRYVGFSTCFRREAGTYGKDTRGIFRSHQFDKVEMNVLTKPEVKVSDKECRHLLSLQEEMVQALGLPYRVVQACVGDLPHPNRRMYDLEVWFPFEKRYREIQSCSNCTDYQTRRLKIKTKVNGETKFVHALNATGIAIGRTILAILENYQQKDGSVKIPKILQKEIGFEKISKEK